MADGRHPCRGATHNLHSLYMSCQVLCIRCRGCGHRKAIHDTKRFREGSMTPIRSLKLKCSRCGGTDVDRLIPFSIGEAATWVEREGEEQMPAKSLT